MKIYSIKILKWPSPHVLLFEFYLLKETFTATEEKKWQTPSLNIQYLLFLIPQTIHYTQIFSIIWTLHVYYNCWTFSMTLIVWLY